MDLRKRVTRLRAGRGESGAEAVEFALIGPLLLLVLIGMIYTLLLFAAQLSVARSATVGARYAAIYDRSIGRYPTATDINAKVLDSAALFKAGACSTPGPSGGGSPNASMTVQVRCDFPNPAGQALNGLSSLFGGTGTVEPTLQLTASATARKE